MTDLIQVLPDLDTTSFSHILPSLEKALISANDLITLDAVDVAKRAQVPQNEVRRLAGEIVSALHVSMGVKGDPILEARQTSSQGGDKPASEPGWHTISTLDDGLDAALEGGFPAGQVTEITGER